MTKVIAARSIKAKQERELFCFFSTQTQARQNQEFHLHSGAPAIGKHSRANLTTLLPWSSQGAHRGPVRHYCYGPVRIIAMVQSGGQREKEEQLKHLRYMQLPNNKRLPMID